MPVTARLYKRFYDQLGDEIVGELVDWFNQVDMTYRGDLRELNELNFARFDAKLEQRITELAAGLRSEFQAGLTSVRTEVHALRAEMERRLGEQSRWLIGMWITIVATAVALWFRR